MAVYTTHIPLIYCQLGGCIYHLPKGTRNSYSLDCNPGFPHQVFGAHEKSCEQAVSEGVGTIVSRPPRFNNFFRGKNGGKIFGVLFHRWFYDILFKVMFDLLAVFLGEEVKFEPKM